MGSGRACPGHAGSGGIRFAITIGPTGGPGGPRSDGPAGFYARLLMDTADLEVRAPMALRAFMRGI